MDITAVIPTRGNVDLGVLVERLRRHKAIQEIIIERGDSVYNRFVGVSRARFPVIYTQDDDCLVDIGAIIRAYKPGVVVNAMTEAGAANYPKEETLIGYGAIFDANLVDVLAGWEKDELFKRECDRVFTSLNEHHTVFPNIQILPCAHDPDRLYKQDDHYEKVKQIRKRIAEWNSKNKQ